MTSPEEFAEQFDKIGYTLKRYKRNSYYDYAITKPVENYIDPICNIMKNRDTNNYEVFFQGYINDIKFLELLVKFLKSLMTI